MEEIIIETVGVGQTELDIMGIADTTAVVLVPESGDTVQTLKAGILEIGNIFVINKADLEGADRLAIEIRSMLKMMPLPDEWDPRVIMCRARDGAGVDEFIDAVSEHRQHLEKFPDREKRLAGFRRQQLIEIILAEMRERLLASSAGIEARETGSSGLEESGGGLEDVFESVRTGEKDPYHAAAEILSDPERLAGILGFKK
jgi:LAO/AO transport system kinase